MAISEHIIYTTRIIPNFVRIFILITIKAIKFPFKEIRRFFRMIRPSVWIVEGDEISSQQMLSIAYIGSDEKYRNYILKLAFGDSFRKRSASTDWLWNIPEKIKSECDMAVFDINYFIKSFCILKNVLEISKWVDTMLDISKPVEQIFSRKVSWYMRRRIKKNNYTYEVTQNKHLFDNFYFNMYIPFARNTFAETAFIANYYRYIKRIKYSELLLLKKEDEIIAGVILDYSKEDVLMKYVGYKDGDYKYVKEGAFNALLYFTVEWVKKKNYKNLGLGLSISFLNDGRLRFKMLKGARIVHSNLSLTPDKNAAIAFLKNGAGLRNFLINNPFIVNVQNNRKYGSLFVEANQSLSHEEIENLLSPFKDYHGIEKWCVYIFGDKKNYKDLIQFYKDECKISVLSSESLFSEFAIHFNPRKKFDKKFDNILLLK